RPLLRRLLLVVAVGVAVGAAPIRWAASGWPPEGAIVVACDVGQGDAIVLPVGPHEAVVVDTGPEPVAADGCLRRVGVRVVPVLVITHFHIDHVGGLWGVLQGGRIGGIVTPSFGEPAAGKQAVHADASAHGVPVTEAGPGWTYAHGGLALR